MPPKNNEIYHGGPVQGRGKSFLDNPGKFSIQMPDGSFKELGRIETANSLPLAKCDNERRWDGIGSSFSFTCEIKDTAENRTAMRELVESFEKSRIENAADFVRVCYWRYGLPSFMCTKREYKLINHLVHKHYNMNFTRYCRSIGIRYFTGFLVLLDGGSLVKRK
jgi:hypothetical protein